MRRNIVLFSFLFFSVGLFSSVSAEDIACTKEYAPVCGSLVVQCIQAPCPAIQETYAHKCMMEAAGANLKYEGECLTLSKELRISQAWDSIFIPYASGKTIAEIHTILNQAETRLSEREEQNTISASLVSLYGFVHFLIKDTRGRFWVE